MKKVLSLIIAGIMLMLALGSCSGGSGKTDTAANDSGKDSAPVAMTGKINVISREDGSGTRGAFIELFGIEEKQDDGTKVDKTIDSAEITSSTSVMMTTVSSDKTAIGYVSMGSLNDTVKAIKIDGVEATAENVKNGSYAISRPFNIVTKEGLSDAAKDFINYILSSDGQAIIEEKAGCISENNTGAFESTGASGKVIIAGSSSVTPAMEKLKEAYAEVNSKVEIEIQQSDSTTGVNSAIEGVCDIGMASRELKDSEKEKGVESTVIALDGVAVIVNNENTIENLTKDDVKAVYTGSITDWSELEAK